MLQAVDHKRVQGLHEKVNPHGVFTRPGNASSAYAPSTRAQLGPSVVRCVQGGCAQEAACATRAGSHAACVEEALSEALPGLLPGAAAVSAAEREQRGPREDLG